MTLKIHSTEAERLTEYRICQERNHIGHKDRVVDGELWAVCEKCGTHFRYERALIESNKPEGAE